MLICRITPDWVKHIMSDTLTGGHLLRAKTIPGRAAYFIMFPFLFMYMMYLGWSWNRNDRVQRVAFGLMIILAMIYFPIICLARVGVYYEERVAAIDRLNEQDTHIL